MAMGDWYRWCWGMSSGRSSSLVSLEQATYLPGATAAYGEQIDSADDVNSQKGYFVKIQSGNKKNLEIK